MQFHVSNIDGEGEANVSNNNIHTERKHTYQLEKFFRCCVYLLKLSKSSIISTHFFKWVGKRGIVLICISFSWFTQTSHLFKFQREWWTIFLRKAPKINDHFRPQGIEVELYKIIWWLNKRCVEHHLPRKTGQRYKPIKKHQDQICGRQFTCNKKINIDTVSVAQTCLCRPVGHHNSWQSTLKMHREVWSSKYNTN